MIRKRSGGVNALPDLVITPFIAEDFQLIEPYARDIHGKNYGVYILHIFIVLLH